MSDRERVEAEAREYADIELDALNIDPGTDCIEGDLLYQAFIAGRTVAAGQMEAVNDAVIDAMIKYGPDGHVDGYEEISTAAAKAAGLLIEGEDDE